MSSDDRSENLLPNDVPTDTVIQDLPPQDGSSDGEKDERTAREKLKKTSIAGLAQYSKAGKAPGDHPLGEVTNADSLSDVPPENGQVRGRPSKKRSFDDLQHEEAAQGTENGGPPLPKKGALHKRMRSREIEGDDEPQNLDRNEDMASPVQEEPGADAHKSLGGPGILVVAPSKEEMDAATVDEQDTTTADMAPSVTSSSDQKPASSTIATSTEQESSVKLPASSGFGNAATASPFANVSTASPFASFKSPKSPEKSTESSTLSPKNDTSTSAFASSGLSAFASSEKSPFGAAGSTAKNSGGFGGGTTSGFGSTSGGFGGGSSFASKPASGFGSGGGFGSGSSGGFGGGGGFGSTSKPFGGGLSSFAGSSGGTTPFAKAKPFGAKNDEVEEASDDGGDEEEGGQQSEHDPSQDPRFHQQQRMYSTLKSSNHSANHVQSIPAKKTKKQYSAARQNSTTSRRNGKRAASAISRSTSDTKPDRHPHPRTKIIF